MPTQAQVIELFDYQEGNLIRIVVNSKRVKIGDIAGTLKDDGYIQTRVDGKKYYNHVLIWLYHKGYLPENDLDHINRNRADNRIENLREVSRSCNNRNSNTPITNTSGVKGVSWAKTKNRWIANIRLGKKQKFVGSSTDFIEAVAQRLAAEQCLNWAACDSDSPAQTYIHNYMNHLHKVT